MEALRDFFQNRMYGIWRENEQIEYLTENENTVKILVSKGEKTVSFKVKVNLPQKEDTKNFENGCPYIICMHPIQPVDYALSKGYAVFVLNTYEIASDDIKHEGCFYDLYPYGQENESQTGVLMAWAWGASKVIDAVYQGLAEEFGLDASGAIVTGVSRWGKATAVCGAFDSRVAMTVPACSGAGGLALYDVTSEGQTYNFSSVGGPSDYVYGKNEPLECLQSDAERGWFNDRFLDFKAPSDIPIGQEKLAVMAMAPNRYYFIIAACTGEDWVNTPSMWECYKRALKEYEKEGLGENLVQHIRLFGHAVIAEDMELMIEYFNKMHYGIETKTDLTCLKKSVFES